MNPRSTPIVPPGHLLDPKGIGSAEDKDIVNIEGLITEDDEPVESVYFEKLMRLLTETLYSSWRPGVPFLALANVGLFPVPKNPALVPDVMLSLGVSLGQQPHRKENHSYFLWKYRKPPDVIIEFVSDRRGGEEYYKAEHYAHIGVPYYVIFDTLNQLKHGLLRSFTLADGIYRPLDQHWFEAVGLGLTLWTGPFEGTTQEWQWLRWCDRDGKVIPTGQELAEQQKAIAKQQKAIAKQERQKRERLEAHLRSLGVDPSTLD